MSLAPGAPYLNYYAVGSMKPCRCGHAQGLHFDISKAGTWVEGCQECRTVPCRNFIAADNQIPPRDKP